jgi:hypothetical protein
MGSRSVNKTNKNRKVFLYIGTFLVTIASLSGILVVVYFLTKLGSAI